MRKVVFCNWIPQRYELKGDNKRDLVQGTGQYTSDFKNSGFFHQWVTTGEYNEDICAIIETPDGSIEIIPYGQVKFVQGDKNTILPILKYEKINIHDVKEDNPMHDFYGDPKKSLRKRKLLVVSKAGTYESSLITRSGFTLTYIPYQGLCKDIGYFRNLSNAMAAADGISKAHSHLD